MFYYYRGNIVPTILDGKVSVPIASERFQIFQFRSGEMIADYPFPITHSQHANVKNFNFYG